MLVPVYVRYGISVEAQRGVNLNTSFKSSLHRGDDADTLITACLGYDGD